MRYFYLISWFFLSVHDQYSVVSHFLWSCLHNTVGYPWVSSYWLSMSVGLENLWSDREICIGILDLHREDMHVWCCVFQVNLVFTNELVMTPFSTHISITFSTVQFWFKSSSIIIMVIYKMNSMINEEWCIWMMLCRLWQKLRPALPLSTN